MFGLYKCASCATPSHVGDDEDFQCRKCGCVTLEKIREAPIEQGTPWRHKSLANMESDLV